MVTRQPCHDSHAVSECATYEERSCGTFEAGTTVEAYWPETNGWLYATIKQVIGDGSGKTAYKDTWGSENSESDVPWDYVRRPLIPVVAKICPQGHLLKAFGKRQWLTEGASDNEGLTKRWKCDGISGTCTDGVSSFGLWLDIERFSCEACGFDICRKCFDAAPMVETSSASAKSTDSTSLGAQAKVRSRPTAPRNIKKTHKSAPVLVNPRSVRFGQSTINCRISIASDFGEIDGIIADAIRDKRLPKFPPIVCVEERLPSGEKFLRAVDGNRRLYINRIAWRRGLIGGVLAEIRTRDDPRVERRPWATNCSEDGGITVRVLPHGSQYENELKLYRDVQEDMKEFIDRVAQGRHSCSFFSELRKHYSCIDELHELTVELAKSIGVPLAFFCHLETQLRQPALTRMELQSPPCKRSREDFGAQGVAKRRALRMAAIAALRQTSVSSTSSTNLEAEEPLWEVVSAAAEHNIRECKDLNSNVLAAKQRGEHVRGRAEGDWLRLQDGAGYMLIQNRQGDIFVRQVEAAFKPRWVVLKPSDAEARARTRLQNAISGEVSDEVRSAIDEGEAAGLTASELDDAWELLRKLRCQGAARKHLRSALMDDAIEKMRSATHEDDAAGPDALESAREAELHDSKSAREVDQRVEMRMDKTASPPLACLTLHGSSKMQLFAVLHDSASVFSDAVNILHSSFSSDCYDMEWLGDSADNFKTAARQAERLRDLSRALTAQGGIWAQSHHQFYGSARAGHFIGVGVAGNTKSRERAAKVALALNRMVNGGGSSQHPDFLHLVARAKQLR